MFNIRRTIFRVRNIKIYIVIEKKMLWFIPIKIVNTEYFNRYSDANKYIETGKINK